MKDKDPNDDELNKDEQDNINEADDSFGLPDLEFNTLDEESEEGEDSAEEPAEAEPEETAESEEIEEPEASIDEEPVVGAVDSDDDDQDETDSYVADEEDNSVKTTYIPPKPESNTPKILIFLAVVVLATAGIWYFGFYRPQANAEKARIEAAAKKVEDAKIAAARKKEAEAKLTAELAANDAADADEAATEEAVFTTISESTGRYYIVIESFIDSDMAADYGKELATKGFSTALLSPQGKRKFHRLTIGDYETFLLAQEEANKLKTEFGEDLWVLKY